MGDRDSRITAPLSSVQASLAPDGPSYSVALEHSAEGDETSVVYDDRTGQGSRSGTAIVHGKFAKRQRHAEYHFEKIISSNHQVTYRMHLRDGSVVRERLDKDGLRFSMDTPSNLKQDILDRLKASVHRLEASYKQSAPDSLGHWYKGSFSQTKTFLAHEIAGIVIRQKLEGCPDPVGYDLWDEKLKKLEELWDPTESQRANSVAIHERSFQVSCEPEGEWCLAMTSASVASDYYRDSRKVSKSSGLTHQDTFVARHLLDPSTGETMPVV